MGPGARPVAGFSRPVPTVVFVLGLAASMDGLSVALRTIPVGTGYALWVGIGAALTVLHGMASGTEPVSLLRVVLIVVLIVCVVGLKLAR